MKSKLYKTLLFIRRFFGVNILVISLVLKTKTSMPVKVRMFFERAGGAFIKLGQILALRQDLLSPAYISELLKLLNSVPERHFIEMQKVFVGEKGKTVGEFFIDFNVIPVASASIGQVYEAYLPASMLGMSRDPAGIEIEESEPDNIKVAVKIQRENIKQKFEADFLIISFLAGLLDFFRIFSYINISEVVSDFISWTRKEMDFTIEAKNANAIYEHSKKHPLTVIPQQYLNLTTPRVLIQEFIEGGVFVKDIITNNFSKDELVSKNIDLNIMSEYLIFDEMRQYFIDGFFHADPHPANLIFLSNNKLVYLDFGIIGEVKDGLWRLALMNVLRGIAEKDIDVIAKYLLEMGRGVMEEELKEYFEMDAKKRKASEKIFEKIKELMIRDLRGDLEEILTPWFEAIDNPEAGIEEKSASVVFYKIINKAKEYSVYLTRDTLLFFRALTILDMVALQISPEFNIVKALKFFFKKYSVKEIEKLIVAGDHQAEATKNITPITELDWEFFVENSASEKERVAFARERIAGLIEYYAEKYEEIRSMIKNM